MTHHKNTVHMGAALGRGALALGLALTLGACAQTPETTETTPVTPQPNPSPAAPVVVTAPAAVFSGYVTQDDTRPPPGAVQSVLLTNTLATAVTLGAPAILGPNAGDFVLSTANTFPVSLDPGQSVKVNVQMKNGATAGVFNATLQAQAQNEVINAPLRALRAKGLEGANEPELAKIVDALGLGVNIGSTALELGTSATPLGSEVTAPLFQKAGSGPVTVRAVARYSPNGPLPFGSFTLSGGAPVVQRLDTLVNGSYQMLNPPLASGSAERTFDPGGQKFGLYVEKIAGFDAQTYTMDALNTGRTRHAVRTYPVSTIGGQAVTNTYLLCFEPSVNGDYQDAVFVLQNVVRATP